MILLGSIPPQRKPPETLEEWDETARSFLSVVSLSAGSQNPELRIVAVAAERLLAIRSEIVSQSS